MLPFSAEVLSSLLEQYNSAIWPAPLMAWLLAGGAVALAFLQPSAISGRIVAGLLATAWVWIGLVFHLLFLAPLFFAAPVIAALFVVQGLLLAWTGVIRGKMGFRLGTGPVAGAALGLLIFAMIGWPVVDWLAGHDWRSARLVGVASAPTAIFTLGILLLSEGRTPVHLALIPLLWSVLGGAGAWVLNMPDALSLPLAGIGGFVLILWKNRRAGASH